MSSKPADRGRPAGAKLASSGAQASGWSSLDVRYRRRQVFGLLLLAAAILASALYRADSRGLFPPGWWRF